MRGLYIHRRFFILLWSGIFISLLAYVFPALYPWVVWGLCMFGVLVLVDFILLYSFGNALEASRNAADKFSNGEENPVTIRIENRYPFGVGVRVIDEAPVEFQRRDIRLFFRLAAKERKQGAYYLRPVKRGAYTFGRVRTFVSTPLSLIERCYSFDEGKQIAVYPSFMAMRKYELLAFAGLRNGNSAKRVKVAGISTAFDQIKPYVQGDDPRTVNWKATAKCDRIMVNSYTEERSQQVYCLVDKGRTMQAPFNGMTTLDYAINATLALSDIILKKGDKAGLLTFAEKPGTLVKADNRTQQLNHINEALYNQQTHYLESDFEQLCITVSRQVHTRSLLILFTNFDTVSGMKRRLPALARLAKSHLLLLILFENTEINQALNRPAEPMQDLYFKAMVGSFISEKRRIAAELRKTGIYTILTEPEQLTANAINGYLELKERGVI